MQKHSQHFFSRCVADHFCQIKRKFWYSSVKMVNQKNFPTLLTGTSHPLSATPEKRISYFPVSCEPPAIPEGSQTPDTDNL